MKYIIIGNGIAGLTAVENIRKIDPSGGITLITQEPYPSYNRIMLIGYLAGEVSEDRLILKPQSWYEERRIEVLLGKYVESIDPQTKKILLSDGTEIIYDRLLIATGGRSFVPSINGADKEGVFTLRGLDDAKVILKYVEQGHRDLILIGGGVLGLEAGNALRKRGCNVTVVEFFSRLLPRQMDAEGAEMLKRQMEDMGFHFYLNAKSKEIIGRNRVEGLLLEDGRKIKGDIVIISAGIRPDIRLAKEAGLEVNKGLIVNDRMETSEKDIFGAGDVIEHRERLYGIWPAAEEQGRVAGINMAGGTAIYKGSTPSNLLKVAGVDLMAAGDIDADNKYEAVRFRDEENFIYKKLVFKEGILSGFILYGELKETAVLMNALKEGWNKEKVKEQIIKK